MKNDDLDRIVSLVSIAGKIDGRIKFQKMVYILQCKGAGFEEWFKYHHYGPYSLDLQLEIDELVCNDQLSEDFDDGSGSYSYSISADGGRPEVLKRFEALISLLNKASSSILELVGTIFFLRVEENITDNQIIEAKLKFLKPHLERKIKEALVFEDKVNAVQV